MGCLMRVIPDAHGTSAHMSSARAHVNPGRAAELCGLIVGSGGVHGAGRPTEDGGRKMLWSVFVSERERGRSVSVQSASSVPAQLCTTVQASDMCLPAPRDMCLVHLCVRESALR